MALDGYSVTLLLTLLDGTTTVLSSPSGAETGSVVEAFGGMPQRIGAGESDLNIKLGTLSDPVWLGVVGADGISFKISESGDALSASPYAFLANVDDGLGISEIWISNADAEEHTVTILAVE